MASVGKKAEQTEAMRRHLIDVATELFSESGYVDTSIEEVCQRAEVTKGALYHHFDGKQQLFQCVADDVACQSGQRMSAAVAKKSDPWDRLVAACDALLDVSLDPALQRITLLDAPAVLGTAWRKIDSEYTLGLLEAELAAAMESGAMSSQPVSALAQVLNGAINQAILLIATSSNLRKARREIGETVHTLLEGLRAGTRARGRKLAAAQR